MPSVVILNVVMLSVIRYADCHYADCRYAVCRGASRIVATFSGKELGKKQPSLRFCHLHFASVNATLIGKWT